MTRASPSGMLSLFTSSVGVTSGFSRRITSLMYALRLGYITAACTVSVSMSQSFSFVNSSKFNGHQHYNHLLWGYSAYRKHAAPLRYRRLTVHPIWSEKQPILLAIDPPPFYKASRLDCIRDSERILWREKRFTETFKFRQKQHNKPMGP